MKSLSSEFVKRFFLGAVYTENTDKEEHLFLLASRLLSIDFFVRGDLASASCVSLHYGPRYYLAYRYPYVKVMFITEIDNYVMIFN